MLCDLLNEMTMIEKWNLDILFSPIQPVMPTSKYLDKSISFAKGRVMAVKVLTASLGQGDLFIGDIIKVFLACPNIIKKNAASSPLALHVSIQPLEVDKLVPRK